MSEPIFDVAIRKRKFTNPNTMRRFKKCVSDRLIDVTKHDVKTQTIYEVMYYIDSKRLRDIQKEYKQWDRLKGEDRR